MTTTQSVGFIGTGAITAAIVKGLCSKKSVPTIHLSPRSKEISQALAAQFPDVHRESSNADVVSKSQIVVLAIRPEQLEAALEGIAFKPEQTVISLVATIALSEIARRAAPASQVCRATPLTTIEKGRGPIVMAPALASVQALFEGLGDIVIAQTEEQMMAFGCAAAVLSTFFELENTVAQWLSGTGVTPANASFYVRSMFSGIASDALEKQEVPLSTLAKNNETAGGLNERVRMALREAGMFARIEQVLVALSSRSQP